MATTTATPPPHLAALLFARIKAEGHDIGGHTMNHPHTDSLTDAQINTEFSAVESVVGQSMTVCPHLLQILPVLSVAFAAASSLKMCKCCIQHLLHALLVPSCAYSCAELCVQSLVQPPYACCGIFRLLIKLYCCAGIQIALRRALPIPRCMWPRRLPLWRC